MTSYLMGINNHFPKAPRWPIDTFNWKAKNAYRETTQEHNKEGLQDSGKTHNPRQTNEKNDSEDVLHARKVDAHDRRHFEHLLNKARFVLRRYRWGWTSNTIFPANEKFTHSLIYCANRIQVLFSAHVFLTSLVLGRNYLFRLGLPFLLVFMLFCTLRQVRVVGQRSQKRGDARTFLHLILETADPITCTAAQQRQ